VVVGLYLSMSGNLKSVCLKSEINGLYSGIDGLNSYFTKLYSLKGTEGL
jgi:hypothetical protein